jgi:hypothetical protein
MPIATESKRVTLFAKFSMIKHIKPQTLRTCDLELLESM